MASKKPKAAAAAVPAVKPSDLPAHGINFAADAGAGMESADADSFAIPFLRVLQSNSPQCDRADGEFIDTAEPGMIFDTVSRRLYDGSDGVRLILCYFERRFAHWGPRGTEGGYRGDVTVAEAAEREAKGLLVRDGPRLLIAEKPGEAPHPKKADYLMDTRNHFVLIVDEDGPRRALLPLASTQIKKSRALITQLSDLRVDGVAPPTFASLLRMTTMAESNDEGNWYGVRFERIGWVPDPDLYQFARKFYQDIRKGKVRVEPESTAAAAGDFDGGDADLM